MNPPASSSPITFIERLIIGLIFAVLLVSAALGGNVRVTWDPPSPEDAQSLEGYNVYEVTFDPPVAPPKPAAEANIPSPVVGSTATYRKINTAPITTQEYVIENYRPGMQLIVRAFNFMGESEDSDVLTLHEVPKKPEGVKAVALLIEQSSNLKAWAPFAVVYTVADVAGSFFRLDIK